MRQLEVRLTRGPGEERVVGQLAEREGRIFFEYDAAFLAAPLPLSPFKLPPEPGLIEHREFAFGPIFGLFDDSLPDGWGLLLMDRMFRQRGRSLAEVSVLDRLAYLGSRTMGALTYHPPTDPAASAPEALDLGLLARAAAEVLRGSTAEVLPQLLRAGGSPGGARPKVLVGVAGDLLLSGEDELPPGYSHWIIKFAARGEERDAGPLELAYAQMARAAGIILPPTRLFETTTGGRFFGVERFDRWENRRTHVHTFGNLIHANFRLPSSDYRELLRVTRILTRDQQDMLEVYRRMAFNVLAHNRDDHVKNFAFRMRDDGAWELAPAYDLTFTLGPGGEHTMAVAGEGRAPAKSHLFALAEPAGITQKEAASILDGVATAVARWPVHAREAGVSRATTREVEAAIAACLGRI